MTARKTLRELRAQHDHLYSPVLPHRPDWSSSEHVAGLERWKAYLEYEEKNPLEIEDPAQLYQRVAFAYRKAIANLRFFSEIWFVLRTPHSPGAKPITDNTNAGTSRRVRASVLAGMRKLTSSCKKGSRPTPAGAFELSRFNITSRSTPRSYNVMSSSLLLAFTLADLEEGKPDLPACYAIYDSLLAHLTAKIASLEADVEAEIAAAVADREEQQRAQLKAQAEAGGVGEEDETVEMREKRAQELEEVRNEIKERKTPEIEVIKRAVANVWIAEMRFARRSDVSSVLSLLRMGKWSLTLPSLCSGLATSASSLPQGEEDPESCLASGRGLWYVSFYFEQGSPRSLNSRVSVCSYDGDVLEQRTEGRYERFRARPQDVWLGAGLHPALSRFPALAEQRQQ